MTAQIQARARRLFTILRRRATPPAVALAVFATAGVLESIHGYIGYHLAGRPEIGYTLHGQPLTLLDFLARAMPSWIVLGLLAGVAMRLSEQFPLFTREWKRSLLFHVPMAALFSACFLLIAATVRHYLFVAPEFGTGFATTLLRYYAVYFNTHFLFYWGTVGLYSGFLHYRDLRERDLQAERLRRSLSEARLRALQQQLEPHFLFNTLNAVSGLALEGNISGTVRTLSLLGELLRATLRRTEQTVTVAEEMQLLERYLDIQSIRLEERLEIRLRIDPGVLDCEIPTFLLQPLVENAIQHGVAVDSRSGFVEIRAHADAGRLHVSIIDSGPGVGRAPVRLGLGLRNCIARLDQLYGEDYVLDLADAAGGGARLRLDLPTRRKAQSVAGLDSEPCDAVHPAYAAEPSPRPAV